MCTNGFKQTCNKQFGVLKSVLEDDELFLRAQTDEREEQPKLHVVTCAYWRTANRRVWAIKPRPAVSHSFNTALPQTAPASSLKEVYDEPKSKHTTVFGQEVTLWYF